MLDCRNPLETLADLTNRTTLDVDIEQSNRYCILLNSVTGKEAYYFCTPIYNTDTRKLVNRRFSLSDGVYRSVGSSCITEVSATHLKMFEHQRIACLEFSKNISWHLQNGTLISPDFSLIPTYNGVLIKGKILQSCFSLTTTFSYQRIRESQSCVCLMESSFRPILVMSALYTQKANNGCQPLGIKFKKHTPQNGTLQFRSETSSNAQGAFEINFYEQKLIQDTPVSGKYPTENNAFGPIAFIGKSNFYGTQWLYLRLNPNKITELQNRQIRQIKLFLPQYTNSSISLDMHALSNRFCSFGSNWNNKVQSIGKTHTTHIKNGYLCIDLTNIYTNRNQFITSSGILLAPSRVGETGYQAVSTGDSYAMPPILCVTYEN